MAHETGHVVARHAARQMVDAYGLRGGDRAGARARTRACWPARRRRRAPRASCWRTRAATRPRPTSTARATRRGGLRSAWAGHLLQKLHAKEGNSPRFLAILSDHPATPDRIDHVNASSRKGAARLGDRRRRVRAGETARGDARLTVAAADAGLVRRRVARRRAERRRTISRRRRTDSARVAGVFCTVGSVVSSPMCTRCTHESRPYYM